MNEIKRKAKGILSTILVLVTVITNSFYVCASEIETEAAYDLEKGGIQTFFIQNEDGEIDVITIEEVKARMGAGIYKVVCEENGWTAGFYIIIVDNQIQAVHSPFYSTTVGEITNCSLIRNSSIKATYAFVYYIKPIKESTGVIATISNSQSKVSKI